MPLLQPKKKTVDDWLNTVDYTHINERYIPTEFAIEFVSFIKLVNGEEGEENKTPPVHLKMLEGIVDPNPYVANLCARGMAKTTVFAEYLFLYIGVFGDLPNFGSVPGAIYVSDSMDNGVKNLRKNMEHRFHSSDFLLNMIPQYKFTDNYIEFVNQEGNKFGLKMFGAKTGIRGSKIFGKRPVLAVLDDLVSDEDANSKASMATINDTVYKGVLPALSPLKRKVIFNGTPFNKRDILYEAVESGAWVVNVYPLCEKFPCEEKEFKGAWEDRFPYSFVKREYEFALEQGKLAAFYQEYMLRIASDEDKLIQDNEIKWYSRKDLMTNPQNYTFYSTSDFSVGGKQVNDFSVILIWAYSSQGDWYLVDGWCAKATIDVAFDELFRLVPAYNVQSAGVEVSGQQAGFISLIQREMMLRSIWFQLASSNNSKQPGIRPASDKMTRFLMALPLFKLGKIHFPVEMKDTPLMVEMLEELSMAMVGGFKSKHDDCIDTISMLPLMNPVKPFDGVSYNPDVGTAGRYYTEDSYEDLSSPMDNYLV